MKLAMPSFAQSAAVGRHILSYSMGAVTAAVAVHAVSPDQGNVISGAIGQIATGVTNIAGGVSTLIMVATATWSAYTASKRSQLAAVSAMPDVTRVAVRAAPSDPAVAEAVKDPTLPKVS